MSYLYNIGYGTCEESNDIQLQHEIKFTKKQFNSLILEVTIEAIHSKIKEHNENYDNDPFSRLSYKLDLASGERIRLDTTFQELLDPIVEILCTKHNFKKIEFEQTFSMFGWCDLLVKDSWKNNMGDQSTKFAKDVQNKLGKLIIPTPQNLLTSDEKYSLIYDEELKEVVFKMPTYNEMFPKDEYIVRENLLEEWNKISSQIDGHIIIGEKE